MGNNDYDFDFQIGDVDLGGFDLNNNKKKPKCEGKIACCACTVNINLFFCGVLPDLNVFGCH